MRSFWFDPYLWVHLAGIAVVPILLELCLVALAMDTPFLPEGLEYVLVAIASIGPILWMQWQRPFCIYSLLPLTLKPEELTVEQRRLLTLFKRNQQRIVAGLVAVFMAWVLWQLYRFAPLALNVAPSLPGGRITGMLGAIATFLLANLFVQVPISVLLVLLSRESQVDQAEPYPVAVVASDFSLIGFPVRRILPELSPSARATAISPAAAAAVTPPAMTDTVAETLISADSAAATVTEAAEAVPTEPAPHLITEPVPDAGAEPPPGDPSPALSTAVVSEQVTAAEPTSDQVTEVEQVVSDTDVVSDAAPEEAAMSTSEAIEPTFFSVVEASAVVEPSPTEGIEPTEEERSPEEPNDEVQIQPEEQHKTQDLED